MERLFVPAASHGSCQGGGHGELRRACYPCVCFLSAARPLYSAASCCCCPRRFFTPVSTQLSVSLSLPLFPNTARFPAPFRSLKLALTFFSFTLLTPFASRYLHSFILPFLFLFCLVLLFILSHSSRGFRVGCPQLLFVIFAGLAAYPRQHIPAHQCIIASP